MWPAATKDLVVLVADANARSALLGLMSRCKSLKIRPPSLDLYVHPERDPGCRLKAHEFLRGFSPSYAYALVMFDREGCGASGEATGALEQQVLDHLSRSGWVDRAAVIVLEPELDIWVWSASPEVDAALNWRGREPDLRTWLTERGLLTPEETKPARPKEALEAALRAARKPRSSSIYQQLAEKVSLRRCSDPAFLKLTDVLRNWFPLSRI